MPVVCDVCRTPNPDSAMFCESCASALRRLAPAGFSAFELSKGPRLNGWPISNRAPLAPAAAPPGKTKGFRTRLGLLVLAIGTASLAGFLVLQRVHIT
ncbi:hypothetical protein J7E70_01220 [Variovorax paradoxus]|nr:hypothetical protein [Variovorax paradoxus]MBT2299072.1 hypothetical protein [Variovorax paradoxus]